MTEKTRIVLQYHDVIEGPDVDASGFTGTAAASYKLDVRAFAAHLKAIHAVGIPAPRSILDSVNEPPRIAVALTFDDGGKSSSSPIADLLDEFGWIGHFFITTSRIGTGGFVTREAIVDLHGRGHVIGTHSVTHPVRMSSCRTPELLREWRESVDCLSSILGTEVLTGSLPGGYYHPRVSRAAATVGLKVLFTSEPTTRTQLVESCLVLGRFTLRRNSSAALAAALAAGQRWPRFQQWATWNLKKGLKRLGGPTYLAARKLLLR